MACARYDFIVIGAGSAGCIVAAVTSANTNAPSMMIGQRAGGMIAADAA